MPRVMVANEIPHNSKQYSILYTLQLVVKGDGLCT